MIDRSRNQNRLKMGVFDTERKSATSKKIPYNNKRRQSRWSWLESQDTEDGETFTYPQVLPSLLLSEAPASLDAKIPVVPGPQDVVVLSTTKLGTKVRLFEI